jgi:hypothetical protein
MNRMKVVALGFGVAASLAFAVGAASPAYAQDCNGALNITVPPAPPFLNVGDSTTVKINLGAGSITGGAANQITIHRVRYELDCNHLFALGVPCTDQGDVMSYGGDATITSGGALAACQGLTWTSSPGSTANEVVFTPSNPIVLNANTSSDPVLNNCFLSFGVKLDNLEDTSGGNSDDTATKVEVVAGFSTVIPPGGTADGTCDNGGASGVSQSSGVFICPTCTGDNCNTSACNTTSGACDLTPIVCGDNDACTTDTCDLASGCVFTPIPPCDDNDACTTDTCNPATGCVFTPNAPCNDNDACTTDTCNPATGCVCTPIPPCNDNYACTTDTVSRSTG